MKSIKIAVCVLALAAICGCDDESPTRCSGYTTLCTNGAIDRCVDGIQKIEKCAEGYRCVVDKDFDGSVECRSNTQEQKPAEKSCISDFEGKGVDYQIVLFQNPDNDNAWEYKKEEIIDGFCEYGEIHHVGETTRDDYETILACNHNAVYFTAKNFASDDEHYEIFKMQCDETKRCDLEGGCMDQCYKDEYGEVTPHQRWPKNTGWVRAICTETTNSTDNMYDAYYVVNKEQTWAAGIDPNHFYHGSVEIDNPDMEACEEDFLARCIGDVAMICHDEHKRILDCGTAVCSGVLGANLPVIYSGNMDLTQKNNYGAWCTPRCHKSDDGNKVTSCLFVHENFRDVEASTEYECSDDYGGGYHYVPTDIEFCDNGCDKDTGKCIQ